MPTRSASAPQSRLPSVSAPLNTICTTASPLALTHGGRATWADSISVDMIASDPAPVISMMGMAIAM